MLGPWGALEYGMPGPGGGGILAARTQGAAVPVAAAVCVIVCPAFAVAAVAVGWLIMCTPCVGAGAAGSTSHEKREPKGRCCTTGNFESTSALNILIMPLLILPQPSLIPEISNRMGECSQNGPFFTSLMKPIAEKYILVWRKSSTTLAFVTSEGFGAPLTDPSRGIWSVSLEIGRVS